MLERKSRELNPDEPQDVLTHPQQGRGSAHTPHALTPAELLALWNENDRRFGKLHLEPTEAAPQAAWQRDVPAGTERERDADSAATRDAPSASRARAGGGFGADRDAQRAALAPILASLDARAHFAEHLKPDILEHLVQARSTPSRGPDATAGPAAAPDGKPSMPSMLEAFNQRIAKQRAAHGRPYDTEAEQQLMRSATFSVVQRYRQLGAATTPQDLLQALSLVDRKDDRDAMMRVAVGVMRSFRPGEAVTLQRLISEKDARDREEAAREAERRAALEAELAPQARRAAHDEASGPGLADRIQARSGSGTPLPDDVRSHLERGLNADLSGVRVHTDAEADKLSRRVGATAFTTGRDIYFQSGRYDPGSKDGLRVIAHEATHVVQQASGRVGPGIDPDPNLEREAHEVEQRVTGASAPSTSAPPTPPGDEQRDDRASIQRLADPALQPGAQPEKRNTAPRAPVPAAETTARHEPATPAVRSEAPSVSSPAVAEQVKAAEPTAPAPQLPMPSEPDPAAKAFPELPAAAVEAPTAQAAPAVEAELAPAGHVPDEAFLASDEQATPEPETHAPKATDAAEVPAFEPEQAPAAALEEKQDEAPPVTVQRLKDPGAENAEAERRASIREGRAMLVRQAENAVRAATQRATQQAQQQTQAIRQAGTTAASTVRQAGQAQTQVVQQHVRQATQGIQSNVRQQTTGLLNQARQHVALIQQGQAAATSKLQATVQEKANKAQQAGDDHAMKAAQAATRTAQQAQQAIQATSQQARGLGGQGGGSDVPGAAEAKAQVSTKLADDSSQKIRAGEGQVTGKFQKDAAETRTALQQKGREAGAKLRAQLPTLTAQVRQTSERGRQGVQQATTTATQKIQQTATGATGQLTQAGARARTLVQRSTTQAQTALTQQGVRASTRLQQAQVQVNTRANAALAAFRGQVSRLNVTKEQAGTLSGQVNSVVQSAFGPLGANFSQAGSKVASALQKAATGTTAKLAQVGPAVGAGAQAAANELKAATAGATNTISGKLGALAQKTAQAGSTFAQQTGTGLEGAVTQVKAGFQSAQSTATGKLAEQVAQVQQKAQEPLNDLGSRINQGQGQIESKAQAEKARIETEKQRKESDARNQKEGGVVGWIKDKAQAVAQAVSSALAKVGEWFQSALAALKETLTSPSFWGAVVGGLLAAAIIFLTGGLGAGIVGLMLAGGFTGMMSSAFGKIADNVANNKPILDGVLKEAAIGGLMGAVFAPLGPIAGKIGGSMTSRAGAFAVKAGAEVFENVGQEVLSTAIDPAKSFQDFSFKNIVVGMAAGKIAGAPTNKVAGKLGHAVFGKVAPETYAKTNTKNTQTAKAQDERVTSVVNTAKNAFTDGGNRAGNASESFRSGSHAKDTAAKDALRGPNTPEKPARTTTPDPEPTRVQTPPPNAGLGAFASTVDAAARGTPSGTRADVPEVRARAPQENTTTTRTETAPVKPAPAKPDVDARLARIEEQHAGYFKKERYQKLLEKARNAPDAAARERIVDQIESNILRSIEGKDHHRKRHDAAPQTERQQRIDALAFDNYQRRLQEQLAGTEYVYRYTTREVLDNYYRKQGKISRPAYMTDDLFHTSRESMNAAQVAPHWGKHEVVVAIPVRELIDATVPRPYGNTGKSGYEMHTSAYPEYGQGGALQFRASTNRFDESWVTYLDQPGAKRGADGAPPKVDATNAGARASTFQADANLTFGPRSAEASAPFAPTTGDGPVTTHPELSRGLPDNLRGRVPVTVDASLPGNTVRVHYELNADGSVRDVHVKAGPNATPHDIQLHAPTVRAMQKYQGLGGRVRVTLDRLTRALGFTGTPKVGTKAWEAKLELEKLAGIIAYRQQELAASSDPAVRERLEADIVNLERQVAQHEATVARMETDRGSGYVAADGLFSMEQLLDVMERPDKFRKPTLDALHARQPELHDGRPGRLKHDPEAMSRNHIIAHDHHRNVVANELVGRSKQDVYDWLVTRGYRPENDSDAAIMAALKKYSNDGYNGLRGPEALLPDGGRDPYKTAVNLYVGPSGDNSSLGSLMRAARDRRAGIDPTVDPAGFKQESRRLAEMTIDVPEGKATGKSLTDAERGIIEDIQDLNADWDDLIALREEARQIKEGNRAAGDASSELLRAYLRYNSLEHQMNQLMEFAHQGSVDANVTVREALVQAAEVKLLLSEVLNAIE